MGVPFLLSPFGGFRLTDRLAGKIAEMDETAWRTPCRSNTGATKSLLEALRYQAHRWGLTPAKCKKILRDEGVAFAPDASHPRLALLAQTAVRKKRKLNFVKESDFAEEIKVSTSLSVSEFVDLVQKVITQKDEKGYCVNVRCILNNITTPFTVLRCGRNKCPTITRLAILCATSATAPSTTPTRTRISYFN